MTEMHGGVRSAGHACQPSDCMGWVGGVSGVCKGLVYLQENSGYADQCVSVRYVD